MLSNTNTYSHNYRIRKNITSHSPIVSSFYLNFVECYGTVGYFCPLFLNRERYFSGYAHEAFVEKKLDTSLFVSNFRVLKGMNEYLEAKQGQQTQVKEFIKALGVLEVQKQKASENHSLGKSNRRTNNTTFFLQALKNIRNLNHFQKKTTINTQTIRSDVLEVFYQKILNLNNKDPCVYQKVKCLLLLKGFVGKLVKDNSRFIKQIRPYLYSDLKGSSTAAGFQKTLYNKVSMQNRRLQPGTNRRKHNHSHSLIIINQFRRINKTFYYIGRHNFSNIVAFVLKKAHFFKPAKGICFIFNSTPKSVCFIRAIPNLISIIETQVSVLLWRNQFRCHLTSSRQALLHRNTKQRIDLLYLCPTDRLKQRYPVLLKR